MNIDLLQNPAADVNESVGRVRLDHEDVSGYCFSGFFADHEARVPLLDQNNFVIFVLMKRGSKARLRFQQIHRNSNILMVCTNEIV